MEDISKMAKEINIHIQKNREFLKGENQSGPVHIVTSESLAGSLRAGIARPKTVIGFPDAFSIGPLWNLAEKTGQEFRRNWLFDRINYKEEDTEYDNKFRNALLQIKDIPNHVPIYIWFGENAEEQTALRFYLYLLREKTNQIFFMNTTKLFEKYILTNAESVYFHTGFIDSKKLKLFYERDKEGELLTAKEQTRYKDEWNKLTETDEVLRVWRNGYIQSVPENHFDFLVLETVQKLHNDQQSKEFILAAQVVGEIVANTDEFIDYHFLEYRIRHLLCTGALEGKGMPKSMRHYRVKLR